MEDGRCPGTACENIDFSGDQKELPEGLLRPGERLDDLQRNGYRIIQSGKLFCFGMDAVLLAAFAQVRAGERALDLGTGTGVIPILLEARTQGSFFAGLEICGASADMARRSVCLNHLENKISIVQGDIRRAHEIFPAASFEVVTSNPPYMTASHGLVNPNPEVAAARHEILCTLEDVVSQAARLLKPRGRFYMVHRPFRIAEIIRVLGKYRLEPKRIRLVHPFADREPNMLLMECLLDGRPRVKVEPPLIIYERPGMYTPEVRELYHMQEGAGKAVSGRQEQNAADGTEAVSGDVKSAAPGGAGAVSGGVGTEQRKAPTPETEKRG